MYEIAEQVAEWIRQGRAPVLARTVSVEGMSSRWTGEALACLPGGESVGRLFAGAAADQLVAAIAESGTARTVELVIGDEQALAAGLACGGRAQVLVQPCAQLAPGAWAALVARSPLRLVTDLDGAEVGTTTWSDAEAAAPDTVVITLDTGKRVLDSTFWPATRLVVVGDGLLAAALSKAAELLDWQPLVVNEVEPAVAAVSDLTGGDAVVVLTHDRDLDGPVLAAALSGAAGYVGALGSRRTQAARAGWLSDRAVPAEKIAQIRGPAGLDIGARTPAEIALSILAEVLSVRTGGGGQALRDSPGPIHRPATRPRA